MGRHDLKVDEYRELAEFRYYLRRFLVFAEVGVPTPNTAAPLK
jgi:hypothetical protein